MNTELRKQAKMILKKTLQINEKFCFRKHNGKCKEAQRY